LGVEQGKKEVFILKKKLTRKKNDLVVYCCRASSRCVRRGQTALPKNCIKKNCLKKGGGVSVKRSPPCRELETGAGGHDRNMRKRKKKGQIKKKKLGKGQRGPMGLHRTNVKSPLLRPRE